VIRGIAIPYEQPSRPGIAGKLWCEVISRGAFRRSVESGKSLRTNRPIFACWGHRGNGRKRWRIASTADGSLRLWEQEDGVHFEVAGVSLPIDFTGVSVKLEPATWRKEADLLWRLLSGGIRHVAILTGRERACYPSTFIETIRATNIVG
jgi:hypothetical protein